MMLTFCALTLLSLVQVATPPAPPSPAVPPDVVTPDDPKSRIELAEKVNGLHGMDIPWHLKATYEVLAADGTPSESGTYEEWRVSEKQYRLALHSQALSTEEYGTNHGVFRTGELDWPGAPLSSITSLIARPVSPLTYEHPVFENYQRSFGANKLPCTAIRNRDFPSAPNNSESFCFARTGAVLLYASTSNAVTQTLFGDTKSVHGLYLAYDIQQFLGGRPWLKVHIDSLEGLAPAGLSALAVPSGATPVPRRVRPGEHDADSLTEHESGHVLKKAYPVYPMAAKQRGVQGTVVLDALINTEGHISWLRVLTGPQPLHQSALDAVKQWIYKPYVLDGQPVEVETQINVVFALGTR